MLTRPLVHPSVVPVLDRFTAEPPSSAVLLAGPAQNGIGAVARYLAAAWCCGADSKPCGSCLGCRGVTTGAGERFTAVDASVDGTVDALDGLRAASRLRAYDGNQVLLIENADRASPTALQGFLKLFEDAPEHAVFILTSNHPEQLPATLRSRCVHLGLPAVPREIAAQFLLEHGVTRTRARSLANASEGLVERLSRFASGVEPDSETSAALALLLQPLGSAVASAPPEGISSAALARSLSDLLHSSYGLPPRYVDRVPEPHSYGSIVQAARSFLTDASAGRFGQRATLERVLISLAA